MGILQVDFGREKGLIQAFEDRSIAHVEPNVFGDPQLYGLGGYYCGFLAMR